MVKFVILAGLTGSGAPSPRLLEGMVKNLPKGFELKIPSAWDEKTICSYAEEADAILGTRVSRAVIMSAPKLKIIQTIGTGVDKIDIDAATERGILVCNAVGENAEWVAEHAMALLLSLAKNLHKYQVDMPRGVWERVPSIGLKGRILGIVGLGSIGLGVARRAQSFGVRVFAVKRHPSEELKNKLGLDFLGGPESLDYVLSESDFVLLGVPLTKETRKLMDERRFQKMKKGALLINISRGEVVDEEALTGALQDGRLAGAGLDVFESEPVKSDNPLLKLKNVVLTPHVGGGAWPADAVAGRVVFLVENIRKALMGERPDNIVDPVLKYVPRSIG